MTRPERPATGSVSRRTDGRDDPRLHPRKPGRPPLPARGEMESCCGVRGRPAQGDPRREPDRGTAICDQLTSPKLGDRLDRDLSATSLRLADARSEDTSRHRSRVPRVPSAMPACWPPTDHKERTPWLTKGPRRQRAPRCGSPRSVRCTSKSIRRPTCSTTRSASSWPRPATAGATSWTWTRPAPARSERSSWPVLVSSRIWLSSRPAWFHRSGLSPLVQPDHVFGASHRR